LKVDNIEGIRFISMAPKIFASLRQLHGIDEEEIAKLFDVKNLENRFLKVKLQSGKGGAFFVVPKKGRFMIKAINEEEYDVMAESLADYYTHFLKHHSFITPIYGCYALYLSDYDEIKPQYFTLMKNVLDLEEGMPLPGSEIYCFDIKGSSSGRKELPNPAVLLEKEVDPDIQNLTLKDADFFLSFKNVHITPIEAQTVIDQLRRDANFFSQYRLIDYSLLLFVIITPNLELKNVASSIKNNSKTNLESVSPFKRKKDSKKNIEIKPKEMKVIEQVEPEKDRKVSLVLDENKKAISQETVVIHNISKLAPSQIAEVKKEENMIPDQIKEEIKADFSKFLK